MSLHYQYGLVAKDLTGYYLATLSLVGTGCADFESYVKMSQPQFTGTVNGCQVRYDVAAARR